MATITPVLPPGGTAGLLQRLCNLTKGRQSPVGTPRKALQKAGLQLFGGQESGSTSRKAVPLRAPGPLTCTSRKSRWAGLRQSGATAPAPGLSG